MPLSPRQELNLLIRASNTAGCFLNSLELYSSLLKSGFHGDRFTFPFVLKACARLASLCSGRMIQTHVILLGFHSDVYVQTSLLDMYSKSSSLSEARQLFDEMPSKSVVSWNSIISAYAKDSNAHESFQLFNKMRSCCFIPTPTTCLSLVSGCSGSTSSLQQGTSIHCYGIKIGFFPDLLLQNAILGMYVRFDWIDDARSLFDSMEERSTVTYTTIIGCYAKLGDCSKAFDLFNGMRSKQIGIDVVLLIGIISACAILGRLTVASSVLALLITSNLDREPDVAASAVHMFAKCGDIISAEKVFDLVIDKNVLLWTSMISSYVHVGLSRTAMKIFEDMISEGFSPNKITIIAVLSACAGIGSLPVARQTIERVDAYGFNSDLRIQTSMIRTYSKCGSLEGAAETFRSIPRKDLTAWSSMINCCGFHGRGSESLALFKGMLGDASIKPDAVVFTDVLSACNHSGLVEEGLKLFECMQKEFGVEASREHYSIMADLLSRAGHLDSSLDFILRVTPAELRRESWTPLLSALRAAAGGALHASMLHRVAGMEGESTGNHILLADMAAAAGNWNEATGFRLLIDQRRLNKEAGWSRAI